MTEKITPAQWEVTNDDPIEKRITMSAYRAKQAQRSDRDAFVELVMKAYLGPAYQSGEPAQKPKRPRPEVQAEDVQWRDAPGVK